MSLNENRKLYYYNLNIEAEGAPREPLAIQDEMALFYKNYRDAVLLPGGGGSPDFTFYAGTSFIQPVDGEYLYVDATGQGEVSIQLPFMDGTSQSQVIAIGDYNGTFNGTDYIKIYDNSFTNVIDIVTTANKILYIKYIDSTVGWKIVGEDKESVYDEYVINVYENVGPLNVNEGERWLIDSSFADSNVVLPALNSLKDSQSMPISIGDYNNSVDGVNNYIDIFDNDLVLVERIETAGRYITLQYINATVGWKIIDDTSKDIEKRLNDLTVDVDLNTRLLIAKSNTTESVPSVDGTLNVADSGLVLTFNPTSNELFDISADGTVTILKDKDNLFSTLEAHVNKTGGQTDELLIWTEYSVDAGVSWIFTPGSMRRQNFQSDGDGIKLLELSIDTPVTTGAKFRLKVARTNSSGSITIEQPTGFTFADQATDGFARKIVLR